MIKVTRQTDPELAALVDFSGYSYASEKWISGD